MKNKIGLAIITCNREDLFHQAVAAIPEVDYNIVINDGKVLINKTDLAKINLLVEHKINEGVGRSKNEALKLMMAEGCEHLFISEDDVSVIDKEVCEKYIRASEISGIKHFNFSYHGPDNKDSAGNPNPRLKTKFKEFSLGFHFFLGGAFSYYHRDVIERAGYIDEKFKNFHEHVEHTYRIIKAGYHPPFWWFADLSESYKMLKDLDPDLSRSVIRKNKLFYDLRLRYYTRIFNKKLGLKLENIPKHTESEVRQKLIEIQSKYGGGNE